MSGPEAFRVGVGLDAHRFGEGRPLVIGGVEIDHAQGLDGHSDADVLCHAICDAVLGAAALGDIGSHFPDSDASLAGASSLDLLRRCAEMVRSAGFDVVNVDATVVAQAPPIAPHAAEMRGLVADALGVDAGVVSVKATTTDRMGFTGRGEGIAAIATALVAKRP